MNKNDLRTGSLIEYGFKRVRALIQCGRDIDDVMDMGRGIQLTDHILRQLGFHKRTLPATDQFVFADNSKFFSRFRLLGSIVIERVGGYFQIGILDRNKGVDYFPNSFRFVHELQLIHRSLTGEEIDITPLLNSVTEDAAKVYEKGTECVCNN